MKIKKITKYKNKLIKLKLIQTKIYNKKQYLNNIKIEDIEYRLKKIFYIIYKYHVLNKKILFIGSTLNINYKLKSLFKNTKHIWIPESVWLKGAISNKKSCFKHLSKNQKINKKIPELLFQLKQSFDLIVIFKESDNLDTLNESYISRIPTISIDSNLNIQSNKPSYKVPGNFQFKNKKLNGNFFYSLLISTLKKSVGTKHFIQKNLNLSNKSIKKNIYNDFKKK